MEGLEGGSKFLGPVLSNHQILLMHKNEKGRLREKISFEKQKMEKL